MSMACDRFGKEKKYVEDIGRKVKRNISHGIRRGGIIKKKILYK